MTFKYLPYFLLLLAAPLFAATKDSSRYHLQRGGLVQLTPGSVVEGSLKHGGTQPDFILDTWNPQLGSFLKYATAIGSSKLDYWAKVPCIIDVVANRALPATEPDHKRYKALLENYRQRKSGVPLSRYVAIGVGESRENALLTHLMLTAAGIENWHVCATVATGDGEFDQSFTIVQHAGANWVVDSHDEAFNGYRLCDLLKRDGPERADPVAPLVRHFHFRRVVRINDFPHYWIRRQDGSGIHYQKKSGGLQRLGDGTIVEGSVASGGLQPNYIVDSTSSELSGLKIFAHAVGLSPLGYWEKIDRILSFVANHVLPATDYDDDGYLALMKEFRQSHRDVPLSRYTRIKAGVCRENALITHVLLKAAGIDNRHVYARVADGNGEEDHAFTVIEHGSDEWVVDSYNEAFNGYRLNDLERRTGPLPGDPVAPLTRHFHFHRIVKVNKYPLYTIFRAK